MYNRRCIRGETEIFVPNRLMSVNGWGRVLLPVQIPFYLLLGIALFDGVAFVVLLLAFAQTDLEFGVAFFVEKNAKGDKGIALFLHLIFQLSQLPFGEQELAVVDG